MTTFENTAALVLGVGRSGAAATQALLAAGAEVRVVDEGDNDDTQRAAVELDRAGALVRVATPFDRLGLLDGVELVVVSPGITPSTVIVAEAVRRGIAVWSEPELAWRLADGGTRIIGVTGTNGKTTTTEMIAAVLSVPAGGNIGTPLVTLLATQPAPPLVVAELSSFQLQYTSTLRCDVAVLLNVADDHLDWHGSVAAYRAAKARIWAGQRGEGAPGPGGRDWAVVNRDDHGTRDVLAQHPTAGGQIGFTLGPPGPGEVGVDQGWIVSRAFDQTHGVVAQTQAVVAVQELAVNGPHNVANVCATVAAIQAADMDVTGAIASLRTYRAGAHRLEHVATRAGVVYINDSKATNPHAAAAAIASFPSVVWIAGGLAKGVDMAPLNALIKDRVRTVVTIGTDGPIIAELARGLGVPVVEAGDLPRAVTEAALAAQPGDVVLLAPACASMDQFRDYADRGHCFVEAVHGLSTGRMTANGGS